MTVGVACIGHVGLAVRDLDESVRFYTEVVGMQLTERFEYPRDEVGHGVMVESGAFVRCESRHHTLSLFTLKTPPEGEINGHPYGLHHIAFEVPSPEELLSLYRHFRASGSTFLHARIGGPGNQPRFYGRDPDGNLVEFYWGIDRIGWDGMPRAYPPIEEIDLESFDFAAFDAERRRAARAFRERSEAAAPPLEPAPALGESWTSLAASPASTHHRRQTVR